MVFDVNWLILIVAALAVVSVDANSTPSTAVSYTHLTVSRARKIQRFLSQPFFVAEVFTGSPGKYVPLSETLRGFREILDGKHDELPEGAFYMVGTIDEAVQKAKEMQEKGE